MCRPNPPLHCCCVGSLNFSSVFRPNPPLHRGLHFSPVVCVQGSIVQCPPNPIQHSCCGLHFSLVSRPNPLLHCGHTCLCQGSNVQHPPQPYSALLLWVGCTFLQCDSPSLFFTVACLQTCCSAEYVVGHALLLCAVSALQNM